MRNGLRHLLIVLASIATLSVGLSGCDRDKEEIDNLKLARFYIEQGNDKMALGVLYSELESGRNQVEAQRLTAQVFLDAEFYVEATRHFQSAIEAGCLEECVSGLIDAYLGVGDFTRAEQQIAASMSDKISEVSQYRSILIELNREKNPQSAIDKLRRLDLTAARATILELQLQQGRYAHIVADYLEDTAYSTNQLLTYARAHYLLGQYEEAEAILKEFNLKHKSRLLTHKKIKAVELLVKINLAQNKLSTAESIYQNFLKKYEGTSYITLQKTLTLLGDFKFDEAIGEIDTLAKNNPENIQVAQVLAIAELGRGNYQAVIGRLEPFRSKLSDASRVILANAYNRIGRPQDSIDLFVNQEVGDSAKIALSRAYLVKGDKLKANSTLEGVEVKAENQAFNLKLAELWFDLGRWQEIIARFAINDAFPRELKFLVINSYLRLDQISRAREYARKEPDTAMSLEFSGYIETVGGKFDLAISYLQKLLELKPVKRSYFLLASVYLENGNYSESLQSVQNGLDQDGDNRALLRLVSRILAESDSQEAYQWLRSIAQPHHDYQTIQILLAEHEIETNRHEEAIRRLTPMMKKTDSRVYYHMARAQMSSDPKASLHLMELSVKAGYSMEAAEFLLGYYLQAQDRENLARIVTLMENNSGINVNTANRLAAGYAALEQYGKVTALAESLVQQGNIAHGHELTGDSLRHQGRYPEAIKIFRNLLGAKPPESLLLKYFATRLAAGIELPAVVLGEADAILEARSELHAFRSFVGTKYIGQDNRSAIHHLEYLQQRFPDDAVLLNNLAWASLDIDPESALIHSKKAYRANESNYSILDTYIRALVNNNKTQDAKQLLQTKLRQDPANAALQEQLNRIN